MTSLFRPNLITKIAFPIALLLCITLYAAGLGYYSFQKYQDELTQITNQKVALLLIATKLSQQSDAIISSSSNLILASSQFERRQASFEIEDRADWMDKLSRQLYEQSNSVAPLTSIAQSKKNLVKNLHQLDDLIEKKLKIERRLKQKQDTLQVSNDERSAIDIQLHNVMQKNKFYSTELSIAVGYYVTQIKQEMLEKTDELGKLTQDRKLYLFVVALISIISMLFFATFIHLSIVKRIIKLQKAVSDDSAKTSNIVVSGNDEITQLAITIKKYIEKSSSDEKRILSINKELSFLATHDVLTKLYNRRYFEKVATEVTLIPDANYCIAIIDIDFFKLVNDKYGHKVGDDALVHIVNIFKQGLRESDILARYGGEEFVVLMPDIELDVALSILQHMCLMTESSPLNVNGEDVKITASFGVTGRGDGQKTIGDCLRDADIALYTAKHNGRNNVTVFEIGMTFPYEV